MTRSQKKKYNRDITEYVYNKIHNILKNDIEKDKQNKSTSTLAKWLPRKGSSFDKKLDFVNKFTEILYPNDSNIKRLTQYRKLISHLSAKLDVVERHICAKNYDIIDFEKIPPLALKHNKGFFLNHEEIRDRYKEHLIKTEKEFGLIQLINKVMDKQLTDFEKEVYNTIWDIRKESFKEITEKKYNIDLANTVFLLDLSEDTFQSKVVSIIVGLGVVASEYADGLFINARKPVKLEFTDEPFVRRIGDIYGNCFSCPEFNLDKLNLKIENKVMIITSKEEDDIDIDDDRCIIITKKGIMNRRKTKRYHILKKQLPDKPQKISWLFGNIDIIVVLVYFVWVFAMFFYYWYAGF